MYCHLLFLHGWNPDTFAQEWIAYEMNRDSREMPRTLNAGGFHCDIPDCEWHFLRKDSLATHYIREHYENYDRLLAKLKGLQKEDEPRSVRSPTKKRKRVEVEGGPGPGMINAANQVLSVWTSPDAPDWTKSVPKSAPPSEDVDVCVSEEPLWETPPKLPLVERLADLTAEIYAQIRSLQNQLGQQNTKIAALTQANQILEQRVLVQDKEISRLMYSSTQREK